MMLYLLENNSSCLELELECLKSNSKCTTHKDISYIRYGWIILIRGYNSETHTLKQYKV